MPSWRRLGASDFGYIYLAGTMAGLGNIVVEGGQSGTLPSMIARDRTPIRGSSSAADSPGAPLATPIVYVVLALIAHLLGYGPDLQMALALVVLGNALYSVTSIYTDSLLGFERTDIRAYAMIGQQFTTALLVVPTLLLGGHLRATLEAQALASFLVCVAVWRSARTAGLGTPKVKLGTIRKLLVDGAPFFVTGLTIALQPTVDAAILAKLSTTEALGWLAAARKLVGVLVFPAGALVSALYPTLCRLHAEDLDGFQTRHQQRAPAPRRSWSFPWRLEPRSIPTSESASSATPRSDRPRTICASCRSSCSSSTSRWCWGRRSPQPAVHAHGRSSSSVASW